MMIMPAFRYGVLEDEVIAIRVIHLTRGQLLPAIKNAQPIDF